MHFPIRRFIQNTEKSETPPNRFGTVQWVLSRPIYRFQVFDLKHVPEKNRAQSLQLELSQWTPFVRSEYYVGWHDKRALVWCWDDEKVKQAIIANGLKPKRTWVLPETVLRDPIENGVTLTRCIEGYEGQFWRDSRLAHNRWWRELPNEEQWLMFQRDAGISAGEQSIMPPEPRLAPLNSVPWVNESGLSDSMGIQIERLSMALFALFLLAPTFWYGFTLFKVQHSMALLQKQKIELQKKADPIIAARSQALNLLDRIETLRSLSPYPEQLALMDKVAQALPRDKTYVRDWDFEAGQLKVMFASPVDISATMLISSLQQAGFKDVKTLPGRDLKTVQFQMAVAGE